MRPACSAARRPAQRRVLIKAAAHAQQAAQLAQRPQPQSSSVKKAALSHLLQFLPWQQQQEELSSDERSELILETVERASAEVSCC